jgi:hypothetical protein
MNSSTKFLLRSLLAWAALTPLASAQSVAFKLCGNLFVVGSSGADDLWLRGVGGNVSVTANGGTAVNGVGVANFSGIWGAVVIATGSGNDVVRFTDSQRSGDVLVSLGSGDDIFYGERNQFGADLWIDAGYAAQHGDVVALSGSAGAGNSIARSLVVTGQHVTVGARDCVVGRDLVLLSGSGPDFLHVDGIVTVLGDVYVATGSNNDQVQFASFSDSVGNQIYGDLVVETGSGNDLVRIGSDLGGISTIGGHSWLSLGSGNDTLELQRSEFIGPVLAHGGDGFDRLVAVSPVQGNVFGPFATYSFESVE